MIKIKDYNKENQKIKFITDMNVSLANAIRRSVLEIPVMAVDEVEIIKNDSALYDEILAHRIGLVPIKTDKTSKETKFKLKVVGPKTVYSKDLSPSTGTDFNIPIVIIDKEQEIELVCDARLGKGIEHIKYSPGLAYYKHNVDEKVLDYVRIDEEGKTSYDEDELKIKGIDENEINKVKESHELEYNIESWGQIEVKNIFLNAIDVLEENLKELDKVVK